MKRIDTPEINYIFGNVRNNIEGGPLITNVHPSVHAILTRNPVVALASAWKFNIHRTGLSPFTLHYLAKPEMLLQDFMDKYFKSKYIHYSYCYNTNLPVVTCRLNTDWQAPNTLNPPRAYIEDRWNRAANVHSVRRREERFAELTNQLIIDKAAGLVNDSYMRCFGGYPILKETWQYLKGVAGIYK